MKVRWVVFIVLMAVLVVAGSWRFVSAAFPSMSIVDFSTGNSANVSGGKLQVSCNNCGSGTVTSVTGGANINCTPTSPNPTCSDNGTAANTASTLLQRDGSGQVAATTFTGALAGNATSATSATTATNATNVGVTDDTTTNATMNLAWLTSNSGNLPIKTTSTKLTFNPSTGTLAATTFSGSLANSLTCTSPISCSAYNGGSAQAVSLNTVTVAKGGTNLTSLTGSLCIRSASTTAYAEAANDCITTGNDASTNATYYPTFATASAGTTIKTDTTDLTFNPSTGTLAAKVLQSSSLGAAAGAVCTDGSKNLTTSGCNSGFGTTDDNSTNATYCPVVVTAAGGSTAKTSCSTQWTFNPSTANFGQGGAPDSGTAFYSRNALTANGGSGQVFLAKNTLTAAANFDVLAGFYGLTTCAPASKTGVKCIGAYLTPICNASVAVCYAIQTGTGGGAVVAQDLLGNRVFMTGLTASGSAQTNNLCTNSSHEVIEDTVGCLVSTRRFKDNIALLTLGDGLREVMALEPVSFVYKKTGNKLLDARGPQVGFIAEQAEKVDKRLVGYGSDGKVRTFNYQQYTAVLTKAIQEQQAIIERLERRVAALEGKRDVSSHTIPGYAVTWLGILPSDSEQFYIGGSEPFTGDEGRYFSYLKP